jgi:hypothetical protein
VANACFFCATTGSTAGALLLLLEDELEELPLDDPPDDPLPEPPPVPPPESPPPSPPPGGRNPPSPI